MHLAGADAVFHVVHVACATSLRILARQTFTCGSAGTPRSPRVRARTAVRASLCVGHSTRTPACTGGSHAVGASPALRACQARRTQICKRSIDLTRGDEARQLLNHRAGDGSEQKACDAGDSSPVKCLAPAEWSLNRGRDRAIRRLHSRKALRDAAMGVAKWGFGPKLVVRRCMADGAAGLRGYAERGFSP